MTVNLDYRIKQVEALKNIYPKELHASSTFFYAFHMDMDLGDHREFKQMGWEKEFINKKGREVLDIISKVYKNNNGYLVSYIPATLYEHLGSRTKHCRGNIRILGKYLSLIVFTLIEETERQDKGEDKHTNTLDIDFMPYLASQKHIDQVTKILNDYQLQDAYQHNASEFEEYFPQLNEEKKRETIRKLVDQSPRNSEIDQWLSQNHPKIVEEELRNSIVPPQVTEGVEGGA